MINQFYLVNALIKLITIYEGTTEERYTLDKGISIIYKQDKVQIPTHRKPLSVSSFCDNFC